MHLTVVKPFAAYRVGDEILDPPFLASVVNDPALLQYLRIDPDIGESPVAAQSAFITLLGQTLINAYQSIALTPPQILSSLTTYLSNAGFSASQTASLGTADFSNPANSGLVAALGM